MATIQEMRDALAQALANNNTAPPEELARDNTTPPVPDTTPPDTTTPDTTTPDTPVTRDQDFAAFQARYPDFLKGNTTKPTAEPYDKDAASVAAYTAPATFRDNPALRTSAFGTTLDEQQWGYPGYSYEPMGYDRGVWGPMALDPASGQYGWQPDPAMQTQQSQFDHPYVTPAMAAGTPAAWQPQQPQGGTRTISDYGQPQLPGPQQPQQPYVPPWQVQPQYPQYNYGAGPQDYAPPPSPQGYGINQAYAQQPNYLPPQQQMQYSPPGYMPPQQTPNYYSPPQWQAPPPPQQGSGMGSKFNSGQMPGM